MDRLLYICKCRRSKVRKSLEEYWKNISNRFVTQLLSYSVDRQVLCAGTQREHGPYAVKDEMLIPKMFEFKKNQSPLI